MPFSVCTSTFFKDNKTAWANRATAILTREIMVLLMNNLHEKSITEVKTDKILTAQALFVICTCVTTLHLCYMENALVFSQSKACYFLHVLPTWRSWCTKYISKLPKEGWVILEGERLTNFSICAVGDGPEEREGKTTMYSLVNILVKIFIKQIWSWKLAWKIFFILIAILIEYKNSILTEHEDCTKEH